MEPTLLDDFSQRMFERFASCLLGEFERGADTASYRAPAQLATIDLEINCNLVDTAKRVEYALNQRVAQHRERKLRATYVVDADMIDGHFHFTARRIGV